MLKTEMKKEECGDAAMDREALENKVFQAIMELPKESWERILWKYFEKYEMTE